MLGKQLNQRQNKLLKILEKNAKFSAAELAAEFTDLTQKTILRDLNLLLDLNLVEKNGRAKATSYSLTPLYSLTKDFDLDSYFDLEPEQREIKNKFEISIFSDLKALSEFVLTKEEKNYIDALTEKYRNNKASLSPTIIKKETERLTIELAWKSSKIEGNTYSLLDTETLLQTGIVKANHSFEEAQMIINHKKALDYILEKPTLFTNLNLKNLNELHRLVVDNLSVSFNIRKKIVGVTGTNYKPLDNEFQILEALENSFELINQTTYPFTKALFCSALLAYIQAFEDGNKRTARLTTNAILLAHNFCPLSYRSIDISEYKKAILLFYEQNNIGYLKDLLIEQYEFATENYFLA